MAFSGRIIIFDDGRGELGPLTDLRASFELRTGMHLTSRRIEAVFPKSLAGYWVPDRLEALIAQRADAPVNVLPSEETLYCINGRWAIPDADTRLDAGTALIEDATGDVVVAHLRRADAEYFLTTGELSERVHTKHTEQRVLYRFPWDVVSFAKQTIPFDMATTRMVEAKVPGNHVSIIGAHPVEVHRTATLGPNVVLDAQQGPIRVHEHAVVRPNAVICGPCSVGPSCTVLDHALIKANTAIGPLCKVAGEVGGTLFQGYANKGHDGHLGDSFVGKWVNLGAGTTNSNLLNTYGEVTMRIEPDGRRHRTGMTFLGTVIGDHVKTAISTRFMTGTLVGTGAMIASTAPPPNTVRRFAWITDEGERVFQFDKFIQVIKAMMARRDQEPSDACLALLKSLHDQNAGV